MPKFGVYFERSKHPSLLDWQTACADLGFPVDFEAPSAEPCFESPIISWDAGNYERWFAFEVTDEWGGIDNLYSGKDATFAHFDCLSDDWEIGCMMAIGFKKASDGIYHSPDGYNFWTVEGALGDFHEGQYHLQVMLEQEEG